MEKMYNLKMYNRKINAKIIQKNNILLILWLLMKQVFENLSVLLVHKLYTECKCRRK